MHGTYPQEETDRVARWLLEGVAPSDTKATIIGLSGDLGAGKTTLTQGIARLLGVKETIQSPTFVVAKFYHTTKGNWKELVHVDAYRIEQPQELGPLGWNDIITRPNTLVVVEWPERIGEALPKESSRFLILHEGDLRRIEKQ